MPEPVIGRVVIDDADKCNGCGESGNFAVVFAPGKGGPVLCRKCIAAAVAKLGNFALGRSEIGKLGERTLEDLRRDMPGQHIFSITVADPVDGQITIDGPVTPEVVENAGPAAFARLALSFARALGLGIFGIHAGPAGVDVDVLASAAVRAANETCAACGRSNRG